ncbi:hypothetical protein KAJ87_03520 [Candidatus Pacearchaeota archaeon]|nr:hypothetical protein [Candidatus Pacearchaeota archaeon]
MKKLIKISCLTILLALATTFTFASWGGIAKFIFMVIPLSFGIMWIIKSQNMENEKTKKELFGYLIFYSLWIVFTIFFSKSYGYGFSSIIGIIFLSSSSLLTGGVLIFSVTDYILILKEKKILKKDLRKFRAVFSLGISIILASIALGFLGKNVFTLLPNIISSFTNPFDVGRVGTTVAENARPYLIDWINQTSKAFFWFFYAGLIFVGINLSKILKRKKSKIFFSFFWILAVSGVLFNRYSSSSILNGTNFLSKLFYFGGLILFGGYCIYIYFNEKIEIKKETIITASWLLFILISGTAAIRFFFLIMPFICFMVGYFVVELFKLAKESKEELLKIILFAVLFFVIVLLVINSFNFTNSISGQAKHTGPSANTQWQKAMNWVRENTNPGEIFVHWWDYGYWVQYLGERPTITDGGHANTFWDHLIGRYLLTTPKPETALSFMKAHEVSYLLIDFTDIGKYSAYSKIGSNKEGDDRYSWIPTMFLDEKQIQETSNQTIYVYTGGSILDEDLIINESGKQILLPKHSAGIGAITINAEGNSFTQPKAIIVYQNKQYVVDLRYLFFNGELIDFGSGIDAGVYLFTNLIPEGQGIRPNPFGALMYFSPKTINSLVVQLYLFDDALGNYPGVELVHNEPNQMVDGLRSQGLEGDFVYYQGLKGPIKIWEINHQEDIIAREEFLRSSGEYAEFDNLIFVK